MGKRKVATKTPKTAITEITQLTKEALQCREMGHWWARGQRYWLKKTPKGKNVSEDRVLHCSRCGAERTQQFDVSPILGKFVAAAAARTKYPPGYLMVGRRLSRAEVMYYNYLQEVEKSPKRG